MGKMIRNFLGISSADEGSAFSAFVISYSSGKKKRVLRDAVNVANKEQKDLVDSAKRLREVHTG